jgi:hypothetical protein
MVGIISEVIGMKAVYKFMPTCAYAISNLIVSKDGTLVADERTDLELLQMDDVQAPPIGTKGTVTGVDDTGSLLVNWDNGSGLNVIYGVDRVKRL